MHDDYGHIRHGMTTLHPRVSCLLPLQPRGISPSHQGNALGDVQHRRHIRDAPEAVVAEAPLQDRSSKVSSRAWWKILQVSSNPEVVGKMSKSRFKTHDHHQRYHDQGNHWRAFKAFERCIYVERRGTLVSIWKKILDYDFKNDDAKRLATVRPDCFLILSNGLLQLEVFLNEIVLSAGTVHDPQLLH